MSLSVAKQVSVWEPTDDLSGGIIINFKWAMRELQQQEAKQFFFEEELTTTTLPWW